MVFGIGYGRTGTRSLTSAMHKLGHRVSHDVTIDEFQTLSDSYDFVSDHPVPEHYKELDAMYPGSKFILTVRDVATWLESWGRLAKRSDPTLVDGHIVTNERPKMKYRKKAYGATAFDPLLWERSYLRHNAEVVAYFLNRPEDLLVTDKYEWEPVCHFLGKSIPRYRYPRIRDRDTFRPRHKREALAVN